MYRDPLTIDADDPICTATTLGNTIVGILFEKTGMEIRDAISGRLEEIEEERRNFTGLMKPLRDFLVEKEKEIEQAKSIERQRAQERLADETMKAIRTRITELDIQVSLREEELEDLGDRFDDKTRETLDEIEQQFNSGWTDIKDHIQSINSFFRDRKWADIEGNPTGSSLSTSSSSSTSSLSSTSCGTTPSSCARESEVIIMISDALERRFKRYETVFDQVRTRMRELELEERRLRLVHNNIDSERIYKLDVNKLSAFGFEDLVS